MDGNTISHILCKSYVMNSSFVKILCDISNNVACLGHGVNALVLSLNDAHICKIADNN